MGFAERIAWLNRRYDQAPADTRFNYVLWPLLLLGAVNLWLTVHSGFPFALLGLLGILVIAIVRVPYTRDRARHEQPATEGRGTGAPRLEGPAWVMGFNRWYETQSEQQRFWILPTVLVVAGGVNMLLTIAGHFPFGLLFLLVLLGWVALRAPYTAGWFKQTQPAEAEPAPEPLVEASPVAKEPIAPEQPAPLPDEPKPNVHVVRPAASPPSTSMVSEPEMPLRSDDAA